MTWDNLKKEAQRFESAFVLDRFFPYVVRHWVKTLSFVLFIAASIPVVFTYLSNTFEKVGAFTVDNMAALYPFFQFENQFLGIACIAFGVWIVMLSLDGYYFSVLFTDESSALIEFPKSSAVGVMTIDVADIIMRLDSTDITGSFLKTVPGEHLLTRLGITPKEITSYISDSSRIRIGVASFSIPDGVRIDISLFATSILAFDSSLRNYLRAHSVSDLEYAATARFVSARALRIRKRRRWWSRDYLGRTPALGTAFSYGRAYSLEKYGDYLTETSVYRTNAPLLAYFRDEAEELETILVRTQGANAIVVGEDADAPLLVAIAMARLIERGEVLPPLEHRRMFLLDPERIVAVGGAKALVEAALQKVLADAVRAGNLIVIIPNIGSFMKSLSAFSIDLFSILDRYLRSKDLHLIVLADTDSYHRQFERNASLMEHFERVLVEDKGNLALLTALERTAESIEEHEGVFFTHPAITAAASLAEQFFSDSAPLDKAIDLLTEISAKYRGTHTYITDRDIKKLIESKTGVPSGGPQGDERAKLLELEAVLGKRVVGQPDATAAVAAAMRRARSGIRSEKKPMGSFLFLGPTGVGKTETAKALAAAYFGSEDAMVRFDMTEFSGGNALTRLIGDGGEEPGLLIAKLREKPFSVFLFDEFEKASQAVRDLFLQLLDEGFITDGRGKKAYARSSFIIATSNAASEEIFRLTEEGKDVSKERGRIIELVISGGIFRPELLNRFDGVILFNPMNKDLTEAVASQLLSKFAKRIEEKGYTLVINDLLVKYIAKEGGDPKFGARPLNRAISEKIEQVIADKIIGGSLKPGSKIEFKEEDLK